VQAPKCRSHQLRARLYGICFLDKAVVYARGGGGMRSWRSGGKRNHPKLRAQGGHLPFSFCRADTGTGCSVRARAELKSECCRRNSPAFEGVGVRKQPSMLTLRRLPSTELVEDFEPSYTEREVSSDSLSITCEKRSRSPNSPCAHH